VYISYIAAGKPNKSGAVVNALGFTAGFTLVFVTLGAFAGTVGRLLANYTTVVNVVTGLIVIVLGLNFLGLFDRLLQKLRFLDRFGVLARGLSAPQPMSQTRFFSSMLFGMVFSVCWTPCVSAFLGSALMMASNQGLTLNGMVMLLVYSLGLGIPFVASAMLIDRLKAAFDCIKRHYNVITVVSGLLLVLLGIIMAAGFMGRFLRSI
jgi:cytochrome c-type biogenesis protein